MAEFIFNLQRFVKNHKPNILVNGTDSNDTISNYPDYSGGAYNVTITARGGNDSIFNAANEVLIDAGAGYDTIENNHDSYDGWGNNVTIYGGDGNDSIKNWRGDYDLIDGGSGRDTILSGVDAPADYCTISGGTGDDRISIRSGSNNVFLYNKGDGNDTIDGFKADSTLSISGSSYSTAESGRDVIVYVGDGSILLTWAATLPSINIVEKISWTLNGTTATYGTSTNTQITLNGIKSLDGISLSGSTVTIANSALNSSDVTISDGYYLALASDVTAPVTTAAGWTISGTTATYKSASNTAGYTLNNNQIIYTAANTSKNLVTVSGVKSTSGLSLSDTTVTVKNSSLNQGTVTISDGYYLALGNDVTQSTSTEAGWSISGTTATYKAATTTAGYKLANNQISYVTAGGGNTLITLKGVKSLDGINLNGSTVTIANSALNSSDVTISDGYNLALASDVTAPTTTAAAWNLNGTTATYKAASNTAGYTLANNKISYVAAGGGNTLITVNGVKSLDGITLSGSTVTVANSALNQGNVTISNGYNLALGNDVTKSTSTPAHWDINGTTATYTAESYTTGYKLDNNQISYITAGGGETLATVSGVKSTDGLSLNGSTVTVANSALNQGNVTISDGYYLALANYVNIPTTTAAHWNLNGTTATYKAAATSAGYTLNNNQIVYNSASGGETLATVSGVKSTNGLSVSGSTITVANSALNNSNVTVSNGYNLALANDVNVPTTTAAHWDINDTIATYKAASTSAGYTLNNNQIVYNSATGGETLITVNGVKSTDGITLNGSAVTVANAALNNSNVTVSNGYNLALGNDVQAPKTTAAHWTLNNNVATYKAAATSAGYTLNNNQIVYNTATGGETLITVNGVKSLDGINLSGSTITVANSSLNNSNVTVSNGYNLALGNDVQAPKTTAAHWDINDTTATYKAASTTAGYTLNNNQIVYTEASGGETLITVNGVKSTNGLSVSGSTITVANSALNNSNVTISDGYILKLGNDVQAPKTTAAGWNFNDNTAIYKTASTSAGYTLNNNQIVYTEASGGNNLATISGIKSKKGLSLNGNIITVAASALGTSDVNVSNGYTLKLANGVKKSTTTPEGWTLSGTNAIYKNVSNSAGYKLENNQISYVEAGGGDTLFTVNGVKSLKGLTLNGNVVTVAKSSVNKAKIKINNGYTLALADDIDKPTTKKAAWSYSNSTATYKSSYKTAGYTLASNGKSITYSKATTASNLATVKGVKSKDGLSLKNKVVTVANSALNKKKVTISGDGYKLKLGSDMTKSTTKKAWSYSNSTATYQQTTSVGYALADNAITYTNKATSKILATVKGAKSKTGLSISGNIIKLKNAALKNKVTVSGGYEFDFQSDYKNATITGSGSADTITARGSKISVNGGKGDDTIKIFGNGTVTGGAGSDVFYYKSTGANVITDYAAEDKISIASGTAKVTTSGSDVIFTVGKGKITVQGGADKNVTYFENGVETIYTSALEAVKPNATGTAITLTADYTQDTFNLADYPKYKDKVTTINAAKVVHGISITGNKNGNKITGSSHDDYIDGAAGADKINGGNGNDTLVGGAGNDSLNGGKGDDSLWGGAGTDTLFGGGGADIFVYKKGNGNDVIADFAEIDTIMVLNAKVGEYSARNGNVTFEVGDGSIVVQNGVDKHIKIVDNTGNILKSYNPR